MKKAEKSALSMIWIVARKTNRVWLTTAGGVEALAGCVMTFRKDS